MVNITENTYPIYMSLINLSLISLIPLHTVVVCAEYCIYDNLIEYCEYGCCDNECCGSLIPIIVGAVIGGIVVISIIVIIICLLIKSQGHKGRVVHPQTGTNMPTVYTTGTQREYYVV